MPHPLPPLSGRQDLDNLLPGRPELEFFTEPKSATALQPVRSVVDS